MIDLQQLPTLPPGWHYEPHACHPDVVHVVWAEHWAAASINFKARTLAIGWCLQYRRPVSDAPVGRHWRDRLVMAAISELQALWKTP